MGDPGGHGGPGGVLRGEPGRDEAGDDGHPAASRGHRAERSPSERETEPHLPVPPEQILGALPDAAEDRDEDVVEGGRVGRYTIEAYLGGGAMGRVWLARCDDGIPVALKVLHHSIPSTEQPNRELRMLAGLAHPNVVQVREGGFLPTRDGRLRPWVAMEHVPAARTLDEWLPDDDPPDWIRRLDIVRQVARGAGSAHRQGVVHHDVKPANILVDGHGHPRLADWGIARLLHGARGPAPFGTPGYNAPEQADPRASRDVDARGDVWALGVVLVEALGGRFPRSFGRDPADRLAGLPPGASAVFGPRHEAPVGRREARARRRARMRVDRHCPAFTAAHPHLVSSVQAIVDRTIAPARGDRWVDGHQVADALEAVLETHRSPTFLGLVDRTHPLGFRLGVHGVTALLAATAAVLLTWLLGIGSTGPMTAYASLFPPPPGSVAARGSFDDVRFVAVRDAGLGRLPALAGHERPTVADGRTSLRPWYARLIEELARSATPPRMIVLNVSFLASSGEPRPGTRALAAAIADAGRAGVPVVIVSQRLDGAHDGLDPAIAGATVHRGHGHCGRGLGRFYAANHLFTRRPAILGRSLGFTAWALLQGLDPVDDFDLADATGRPRVDPSRNPQRAGLTVPLSGVERASPSRYPPMARMLPGDDVLRSDDEAWFTVFAPPRAEVFEAATTPLDECFDADGRLAPAVARTLHQRVVVVHDQDGDLMARPGPAGSRGGIQGLIVEDLLNDAAIRMPVAPSVWITVGGALLGVLPTAWLVARRPAAGRRLRIQVASMIAAAGIVVLAATAVLSSRGVFVFPLPPLVAAALGAVLAAQLRRPLLLLERLGVRTHRVAPLPPPPRTVTA